MLRRSLVLALVVTSALAGAASAQTPPTKIGVAAAVNQQLTGTPPSAASRVLQIGNDVFHRERLVTDARGQAQMLFVDGSAFTVGPDSDLLLDEFVYDPASGTGKLAATAAKGVIRFVGGKLSKNQPVTISTPTATIGIRGGIGIVSVDATSGATRATFLFGQEMTVTSATGAVERVARPGFTTTVQTRATAPTAAVKATGDQIKQNLDQLNGRPGVAGGAPQQPTDNQVAVRMPPQGGPLGPPPPGGPKPPGPQQQGPLGPPPPNRDATQQSQQNAANNAGLPAGSVVAYRLDPDPALGSGRQERPGVGRDRRAGHRAAFGRSRDHRRRRRRCRDAGVDPRYVADHRGPPHHRGGVELDPERHRRRHQLCRRPRAGRVRAEW